MGQDDPVMVDRVWCNYGDFTAVRNVSFRVGEGEVYALLGSNGAGKTTLLETIQGFRRPSSGRTAIFAGGAGGSWRTRVGFMLQESALVGDLTAGETVRYFGSISGRVDDEARILSTVGMLAKRNVKVSQLSGGEKRRLDFGTALYGKPDLIFLDEPTTGMDPDARSELWATVAELKAGGASILVTTHYLEEAEEYADRIGLIHRGEMRLEGTLSEVSSGLPSVISFRMSGGPEAALSLPLKESRWVGERAELRSYDLQADMWSLLRWAESEGRTLNELAAAPSGLRHIFESLKEDD